MSTTKFPEKKSENLKLISCGLVMPISAVDGCSPDHWLEVKGIITESVESIKDKKFNVKLVSDSDEIGVIQKRIVQSLYDSDIIVCDVSGKNPNVMFELGMRLAFDKPTVIVKDDKTDYSFDTSVIEHITYPRDLRFSKINLFKEDLARKVLATHEAGEKNQTSFLKNFGKFQVAEIDEKTVSADTVLFEMISEMQKDISSLKRQGRKESHPLDYKYYSADFKSSIIKDSIETWQKMYPEKPLLDLIGDSTFYSFIEKHSQAQRYFDNKSEFEYNVNRLIRNMSRAA